MNASTYERWRIQYGGMKSWDAKRLRQLDEENRQLKQLVTDLAVEMEMLKHL